VGRRAWLHEK